MKYAEIKAATSDSNKMSKNSSSAVSASRVANFSPANRSVMMAVDNTPGGLELEMPCRNPYASADHAAVRPTRWLLTLIKRITLQPNQFDANVGEVRRSNNLVCRRAARRPYAAKAPLPLGVPHPAYDSYITTTAANALEKKLTTLHISGRLSLDKPPVTNAHAVTNSLHLYDIVTAERKYTLPLHAAIALNSWTWSLERPFSHRANRRIASEGAWFATIDNVVRALRCRVGGARVVIAFLGSVTIKTSTRK